MLSLPTSGPGARITKEIARLHAAVRSPHSKRDPHSEAGAAESGWYGGEGRTWLWLLSGLFVAALALRLQNLDSQPRGDEAYYYFIAHDLSAFWNTNAYPVSGSTFPVFPLVYHLFAGNLESLRIANAIVGASAVPLGMLLIRELGAGRAVALAGGAFLAVNSILVQFSGFAFLDMLGAVIGLGALLAYLRGHRGVAAALVAVAVLEKEYYAILGLALAVDQLIARRRLYLELAVAAIPVLVWLLLRYGLQHSTLHYLLAEHRHDALNLGELDQSLGSLALLPLAAASLVLSAKLRSAALYVVLFLLAQVFWGNTQPWYWCLSVVLVTLLAAHGVMLVLASSWRRRPVLGIMAVLVLAGFVAQAGATIQSLKSWHGRDLDSVAAYLDGQPAQPIELIACDWSYQYYPLGGPSRPAKALDGWDSISIRLAVACPGAPPAPPEWRFLHRFGSYTVLGR